MGFVVVWQVQCLENLLGGVVAQLAGAVVEVLLHAENVGSLFFEKIGDLLVQFVAVVLVHVEQTGVVAHHLDAVGARLGLFLCAELEVLVNVVDVQQNHQGR